MGCPSSKPKAPPQTLAERVASRHLPPLDLMLHLGGQVSLERAFEDAWALLKVR